MTILDALSEGLIRLKNVNNYQKKIDEAVVKSYAFVIQDLDCNPYDVEKACQSLSRENEGNTFPTGPVLRKRVIAEKYRREQQERQMAYQSKQLDPLADDDDWIPQEEAKAIINAALARMSGKQKSWPGEEKPKDMKREIARMKSA